MIPELGHFALILALCVSIAQGVLPLVGAHRRHAGWIAFARPAVGALNLLLLVAFASGLVQPATLQLGAGVLMAEMLLFFIPALMSLLDYGGLVRTEGWRILLVIGCSTLAVMLVTAFTVELVCRWRLRHEA